MDPTFAPYALATSLKPSKAFAVAFAGMVLALAGCATGLGPSAEVHSTASSVARVEEAIVLASHPADAGYAYTVRLNSGELVSVSEDTAVANGALVLVEYSKTTRMIPQPTA
jgi:hypothetical protein